MSEEGSKHPPSYHRRLVIRLIFAAAAFSIVTLAVLQTPGPAASTSNTGCACDDTASNQRQVVCPRGAQADPNSLPLGIQPWSDEARQYITFSESDDATLPRMDRGTEQPVSHVQFLQCLADRLNVDVATRTQRPLVHEETDPLMIFPMMMELSDHRALMCNMDTTIRYVIYVDNGGLAVFGRFLDDVIMSFGWTGRIAVRRAPWNAGCAGAVNYGFHWALQLPHEEVPFVHFTNNDVRYPPEFFKSRIQQIHRAVAHDITRIRELEAEVAKEDADPATWAHYKSGRALRGEWSPNATLVTSKLLPDRIRYMPLTERIKQFNNHTGIFTFSHPHETSTFCVSRLAILTVGYNDENFFPAYFEDVDYKWRTDLLGFKHSSVSPSGPHVHHFGGVIVRLILQNAVRSVEVEHVMVAVRRALGGKVHSQYDRMKWGDTLLKPKGYKYRNVEPFMANATLHLPTQPWDFVFRDGEESLRWTHIRNDYQLLPLDAWVRGRRYQTAIRAFMYTEATANVSAHLYQRIRYNLKLTDVFATKQE